MKKRKSFLTLLLTLIVAIVLSACGGAAEETEDANQDNEKETETGLLQEIKDRGVMKVGVMGTYQPYNFLNKNKEMDGFDVDIAKEVAKRLGVEAEFVAQEFSGMIAGLTSGKV